MTDDLRLQLSQERRETDKEDAKQSERMSVLEERVESLRSTVRWALGAFAALCVSVVGAAAAIILTGGNG